MPLTETVLIAHHLRTREMHHYINERPLRHLRDPATPQPVADDERGRSNQRFVVDTIVRTTDNQCRVTATGRDIYAITAPIVVEAVERIVRISDGRAGAFALGQIVDASDFLQTLTRSGEITLETSVLPQPVTEGRR